MAADVGCERDVVHKMNEGYRAWGALKSVLSNRGLGIKAKKCLYEGVIVPIALYGAESWGMRSADRRIVNVLQMKCLRSLVGVSLMNKVRNEEVRRRAGGGFTKILTNSYLYVMGIHHDGCSGLL